LDSQIGADYNNIHTTAIKVEPITDMMEIQSTSSQINPLANIMATAPSFLDVPQPLEQLVSIESILAKAHDFTVQESAKHIASCMDRILDMESFFIVPPSLSTSQAKIISTSNDTLVASRFGWMLIVVRLATRSGSNTVFLKNKLMSHILKDFRLRYCSFVIIEWIFLFYGYTKNFTRILFVHIVRQNIIDGVK
jgi:ABC-type thiamin/hydroxymethylpyrimidine transport system permease subunit